MVNNKDSDLSWLGKNGGDSKSKRAAIVGRAVTTRGAAIAGGVTTGEKAARAIASQSWVLLSFFGSFEAAT